MAPLSRPGSAWLLPRGIGIGQARIGGELRAVPDIDDPDRLVPLVDEVEEAVRTR